EAQHDLDKLGIAKNAREEKLRAREAKLKQEAENGRMEKLYRQHILKEPVAQGHIVPLTSRISPAAEKKEEVAEEVFGDWFCPYLQDGAFQPALENRRAAR